MLIAQTYHEKAAIEMKTHHQHSELQISLYRHDLLLRNGTMNIVDSIVLIISYQIHLGDK